jgi:dihydrolipoamide dehydrogenase
LAHVASAEGINCVEKIAGLTRRTNRLRKRSRLYLCYSRNCFGRFNRKTSKEKGYELKIGKFPFSASGKAKAAGTPDGFVKVIFDAKYGEWLGCHMIGAGVTDMIAEAVVARKLETTGHEILKAFTHIQL